MWLARIRGRRRFWRFILPACLFLATPAHSAERASAPRSIVLPQKLIAGAPATLAVLDAAGRTVPGVVVDLSSGSKVTTDVTGRALFTAPRDAGVLMAQVSGRNGVKASTVVGSPDSTPNENPSAVPRVLSYPRFLSLHDRFTIEGAGFRGAAEANRVLLAGQSCLVLASSPVSLVAVPGLHVPIGDAELRLSVAGVSTVPYPVVVVLLEINGPAGAVNAGADGELTVHVRGAREPLLVEVRNASPGVIQLLRGNPQRVTTSGGEPNAAEIEMKFLAPGNYEVTARLAPPSRKPAHP